MRRAGLELSAGRVSGVVTESGTIRTKTVVMAGGAWASSFCHQLGIRFPQASVRSSILAVAPGVDGLPGALYTSGIAFTRRGNGGYTLAISGRARVDPTPQQLRFAREFVPMFARRWRSLGLGGLEGWRQGHETLAKWAPDEVTPMERNRILDPRPDMGQINLTYQRACELIPDVPNASPFPTHGPAISTARPMASRPSVRLRAFPVSSWRPASAATASGSGQDPGI